MRLTKVPLHFSCIRHEPALRVEVQRVRKDSRVVEVEHGRCGNDGLSALWLASNSTCHTEPLNSNHVLPRAESGPCMSIPPVGQPEGASPVQGR